MNGTIMRCVCAVFLLFAGLISLAAGEAKDAIPGDNVFVTASPDLKLDDTLTITLKPTTDKYTVVVDVARHGFTISLSSDIVTGQYEITAQRTSQGSTQPTLLVPTPKVINVQPVVTSTDPKALYRDGGNSLTFLGPPSLKYDTQKDKPYNNYEISFEDHALTQCKEGKYDTTNCFLPSSNSHDGQIQFQINPAFLNSLSGKQTVYLVHNGAKSQAQTLTVVAADKNTPRNTALAVAAGLVVLVYLLLSAGRRGVQGDKRAFLLSALFLDEETQTYSLSKCQFYAWTLAAILGYVFLVISTSVVQGSTVFPDIPDGLPGIILASAGTAVLATGITSSKGTKGAGPVHPTLADFITNGGVVAPERLQFVVWTVVGIVTFLTIVFSSDPLTVNGLPKIPSGFLELMGISSAGYLAGKLVRDPGPIIQLLTITEVNRTTATWHALMKLELKGQNLSDQAVVKVDNEELAPNKFAIVGKTKQDPASNTPWFSVVEITLLEAEKYLTGSHLIYLVNDDGQSATETFPVNPVSVDPVPPIKAGQDPITLQLLGRNYSAGFHGTWVDASGREDTIPDANIKFVDENQMDVTLVPGAAGAGKLILETPAKLLGIAEVKVG